MKKPTPLSTLNTCLALFFIVGGLILVMFSVLGNVTTYLHCLFVKAHAPKTFAFETYDNLLKKYVHKGTVDYAELKGSKELTDALAELEVTSPDNLSPPDKDCYWLNADNLLTMKLICDKYPITTVEQLGHEGGTRNFIVGGKIMTAKEVDEEQVLTAVNKGEWRLLFSRCTGALGGPTIMNHAFNAATREADLKANVFGFVLRKDNWSHDPDMNRLYLTEFYRWYRSSLGEVFNPIVVLNHQLPEDQQITEPIVVRYNIAFDYQLNDYASLKDKDRAETSKAGNSNSTTAETSSTTASSAPDEGPRAAEESASGEKGDAGGTPDPTPPSPGTKPKSSTPVKIQSVSPTAREIQLPMTGITVPGAEKGN